VAGVPLVGTVIAVATRSRDRVGRTGLLGLLVGLVGVAAIVGVSVDASNTTALLEVACVVIGYAVGPAILSRRLGDLPSVGVMALSLSLCAIVYAPIAVLQRPAVMPSANVLVAIAILGVACTAVAFVSFAALIEEVGPVRATVVTYVNPAVAAVLGVVVLQEPVTVAMGVGLGLVLLGSVLAARPSSARRADAGVAVGLSRAAAAEADESGA
jgi:drug/metabolite transporter (DMT)-like permease